jgi:SAM-dependent methyltransferase
MTALALTDCAFGYDCLAPFYDAFTAGYAYERWISAIEHRARGLGLRGHRALDVACGTGKSTEPLFARGYSVLACDISEGMVSEARRKFPDRAESFLVADMRSLPPLGEFDLIICLDDSMNYLLEDEELEAAFQGIARCLSRTGVFVFDVNSLATYRTSFAATEVREEEGLFFAWRGETEPDFQPGGTATATTEIFAQRSNGCWERSAMRHVQRHHAPDTIRQLLEEAGMSCRLVVGQKPGATLEDSWDEERNTKLLYFATLPES